MSNAVTSLSHVDPPAATAIQPEPRSAASAQKPPQSQAPAAIKAPVDSVQISSAAQAALQEALERKRRPVKRPPMVILRPTDFLSDRPPRKRSNHKPGKVSEFRASAIDPKLPF
jgi:hypothetical protein